MTHLEAWEAVVEAARGMSARDVLAASLWLLDREIAGAPLPAPSWETFRWWGTKITSDGVVVDKGMWNGWCYKPVSWFFSLLVRPARISIPCCGSCPQHQLREVAGE